MRENIAYLRQQGASKEEIQQEIARWGAVIRGYNQQEAVANKVDQTLDRTFADDVGAVAQSVSDAQTFGLSGLITDALAPGSFRSNRDIRQASREQLPAASRLLAGVAGGLTSPANTLIPGVGINAGLLKTAGYGAVSGGAQGAAQYVGENVGTTEGIDPLGLAVSAGTGTLLGGIIAPIASKIARRGTTETSRAVGEQLKEVTEADAPYARPTPPVGPDMPPVMALDVVGPNALARARGAAQTVPGREALREPFEARAGQMPSAMRQGIPDAVRTGNQLEEARRTIADPMYADAIEATKGQPIVDPVVDELLSTPAGQAAWRAEQVGRQNRVVGVGDPDRALPKVPRPSQSASSPNALYEAPPDAPFGEEVVEDIVPDAEAIHGIKRRLAEWARVGEVARPEGVDAIAAQDALKLFARIRDVMPAPFRAADIAYEAASKPIEAVDMGRTPWKSNPNPASAKGEALAIPNVRAEMRGMTPQNRALVKQAKQFDIATRIGEGSLSLDKAVAKLRSPSSSLSRELKLAGGPLQARIPAWGEAMRRQNQVLPKGLLSMEPSQETLSSRVAGSLGPTARVTAVRTFRNLIGQSLEKQLAQRGAEDAMYNKLIAGTPQDLDAFLAKYVGKDKAARDAIRSAIGTARAMGSGSGGLLDR